MKKRFMLLTGMLTLVILLMSTGVSAFAADQPYDEPCPEYPICEPVFILPGRRPTTG